MIFLDLISSLFTALPMAQVLAVVAVLATIAWAANQVNPATLPAWLASIFTAYQARLRYTSVQAARNWSIVMSAWGLLPPDQQQALLAGLVPPQWVTFGLALAAFIRITQARGTYQPELHPESAPQGGPQ